jgi:hypothetical protein
MSTILLGMVWPLQMSPTQKAVLISLADNANDHGHCWPSIPTICERTCLSERAVHGAIKWLEEHRALIADRSNGRHSRYVLTPHLYTPAADAVLPPQEMRHRTGCTTAAGAKTTAADAVLPPQQVQKPPQELRSNRQEPSLEPSEKTSAPGSADADPPPAAHVEHDVDLRIGDLPPVTLPTPAFQIPTNTGEEFPIYAEMVEEFRKAYPAVDVDAQIRSMRAWSISNPKLRKTKTGMLRFINGWLAKEQDRSRPRPLAVRGRLETPQSTDEYGRL